MRNKSIFFALALLLNIFHSFGQNQTEEPSKNVVILLYDGVEIIDYTAPYEVLAFSYNVFTVAQKKDTITTWRGMKVIPDYSFYNCPAAEIIIIPGGNTSAANKNPAIHNWIKEKSNTAMIVMSVCNGANFLATAGLLDKQQATTTSNLLERLKELAPSATIIRDKRFVDNGKIITTAGFSSGIDGALHIISKLQSPTWATVIARRLEYNWNPDSKYAAGALADCNVYKIFNQYLLGKLNGQPVKYKGDRKQWVGETLIKTQTPIDSLITRINEQIKKEEGWILKTTELASGSCTWAFVGKDKTDWIGISKVSITGKEGEFKISISIKRK